MSGREGAWRGAEGDRTVRTTGGLALEEGSGHRIFRVFPAGEALYRAKEAGRDTMRTG